MTSSVDRLPMIHAPNSPLRAVLEGLHRIARSDAPVLVTGESGTGKEGVVRLVHELGARGQGPFVAVNCGAIPSGLLESELFGHVRGAFTGADRNRVGRFEAAAGGTLFLDEIGETPHDFQVKLLRVLQERVFAPVGTSSLRSTDVRVIAATNVDLRAAIATGRLREDLLFRLDVVRVQLPPLRDRLMDVAPLARHFIALHRERCQSRIEDITPEALDELRRHRWPGNVRELENVIQNILVMKESGLIELEDVRRKLDKRDATRIGVVVGQPVSPYMIEPVTQRRARPTAEGREVVLPEGGVCLKDTLERVERDYIRQALARAKGNRARAAMLLGLNRTTLVEKLRRMPEWADEPEAFGAPADNRQQPFAPSAEGKGQAFGTTADIRGLTLDRLG